MKKLAALFLCAGMLFSMAACGGSKVSDDALDKLETSIKKFSEVKSANYTAAMDVTADKENVKLKLYGDFITETKKPLQMSLTIDMEASGTKMEKYMQLFIKDDNVYMNMMQMSKQKTTLKEMMGSTPMPSFNFDADTFKMNKEDMKKYLKEASVDGDKLKLSFDPKKMNEEVTKAEKEDKTSSSKVNFKKFDMDVTLKDGFMEKAVITMDATTTAGETKQEIKGTITLETKNINKVTSINYPDLTEYKAETAK